MLTQHYLHYLWITFSAGMLSLIGAIAVLLVLAAIACRVVLSREHSLRNVGFWSLLLLAVVAVVFAFRGAVYTFPEDPDSLDIPALAGEPDCGTSWSGWIRGGYGMGNPCELGCYRGKVLNKQMRMRGFPPWPEYRREMQCWVRDRD